MADTVAAGSVVVVVAAVVVVVVLGGAVVVVVVVAADVDGVLDVEVGEVDLDVVPAAGVAASSSPSSQARPPTAPNPATPARPISSRLRAGSCGAMPIE